MKLMQRLLGKWYDIAIIRLVAELVLVIIPIAFLIRTVIFGLYQVPSESMETTLLVGERFFADKLTYWFRAPARGEIIAFNQPNFQYSTNPFTNFWQNYVSWNIQNWTKRVIGVPGDHVKGVIEDGKPVIYVNEKKLDQPFKNTYPLLLVRKSSSYAHAGVFRDTRDMSWVSFDPKKNWADQPFYAINPQRIVIDPNTMEPVVRYPDTAYGKDEFDIHLGPDEYWVMGDNRGGSSDSREFGPLKKHLIHGRIVFRILSMDTDESWMLIDLIKNPIAFFKKIRWSRCMQFVS